jgi:hypothetical protein
MNNKHGNKFWKSLLQDHTVLSWIADGKYKYFRSVLELCNLETITIDELKRFALMHPNRIYTVLDFSQSITAAVKEFGFDWKEFFLQPILDDKRVKLQEKNIFIEMPNFSSMKRDYL